MFFEVLGKVTTKKPVQRSRESKQVVTSGEAYPRIPNKYFLLLFHPIAFNRRGFPSQSLKLNDRW